MNLITEESLCKNLRLELGILKGRTNAVKKCLENNDLSDDGLEYTDLIESLQTLYSDVLLTIAYTAGRQDAEEGNRVQK